MPETEQPVDKALAAIRTPPHSIEAEQSVLGGLLLNNRAWDEIADILRPEDFYRADHQLLYTTIVDLVSTGKPADAVTVYGELQKAGRIEEAGGLAYINEIVENVPSSANIRRYAEIVRDRSVLRHLVAAGDSISTMALAPEGRQTEEILDEAESSIFAIAEGLQKNKQGFVPVKEVTEEVLTRLQELQENDSDISGIPTGLTDLDHMTSGLQAGNLVILAARPSMGKTALALNIGENIAYREKMPVAVFSMEMGAAELVQRMVCSHGRVDSTHVRSGKLDTDEWSRFAAAAHDVSLYPMEIDPTPGLSPTELRSRAKRLSLKYGHLGLVVVDYLQLMRGSSRAAEENRATEVAEISRGLKALAKELSCPVLALSQLNRSLESRDDKRPRMSDLRESGAIEQDADVIIFIYRDERYNPDTPDKNIAEIIIGKQRNGPVGTVRLRFDGQYTRFDNLAREAAESYQ